MLTINYSEHAITLCMSAQQELENAKGISDDRLRAGSALRSAYYEAKRRNLIANQEELAELMGFSRSFISQFFGGERGVPYAKIHRLAELLQCVAFDIADDTVRDQLKEESDRIVKLASVTDYFVVKEAGSTHSLTNTVSKFGNLASPIQLRVDLVEAEGMTIDDVRIVKLSEPGREPSAFNSVIVRTDKLKPLVSGYNYALSIDGANVIKTLTTQEGGVVIAPSSQSDATPPRYVTTADMKTERVVVLGLVWLHFGRAS